MIEKEAYYKELIAKWSKRLYITEQEFNDLQDEWLSSGESEALGAGLTKVWFTGWRDPLCPPAIVHDIEYSRMGTPFERPINLIDEEFYKHCLDIAKHRHSRWLRVKAKLYYKIVCLYTRLTH